MNFLNSIKSWLDLNIGISKKAQMCLAIEGLGGQSASLSYHCMGEDIIPELKQGKPIFSDCYYLYRVTDGGRYLESLEQVMKYDANSGTWLDSENTFTKSFTHYIPIFEHTYVMEKALENAKFRISNET
jgi:hypothetical protein